MALDHDGLDPEVIMPAREAGPSPITPEMAAGMLKTWLTENWDAREARFVCRVSADGVVVELHEETTFRRDSGA
jgi:hypothetical protein